jgi:hypothetical protein
MALTTIESNNKLVQYTKEINREFVRENLFSPYMGEDLNSVIRRRYEPKSGGEQMNIPLVTKLTNDAISVGTLVGAEEKIENYGMRVWLDWARNAVVSNKAESQKDSADVFGEAKPLLSDWGKELQRDEIIEAFMAFPSESAPSGLGSANGQRVNGLLYQNASDANANTWVDANGDRILYGNVVGNLAGSSHATDLAKIDSTADLLKGSSLSLMKRIAMNASPAIRPYRTKDGYEWFVCFVGSNTFRDLKGDSDIKNSRLYAMTRDKGEDNNPLFQDGDVVYDGVIVRQVPEISSYVTNTWTGLLNAGATTGRVEPVFFCGKQALVCAWGQMAKPTFRKEDDYGFVTGAGVEMAYGCAKMFKKHPATGSNLVQWGVVTGFFRGDADA